MRFRFLEDPYFVDQLYLKDKGRLAAFAYLLLTALLIYTLLDRRVRQAVTQEEQPMVRPGKVKYKNESNLVQLEIDHPRTVLSLDTGDLESSTDATKEP